MRDLTTIINDNQKAQRDFFARRFQKLMEDNPNGFTCDGLGNRIERKTGYVVAFKTFGTFEDFMADTYVKAVIKAESDSPTGQYFGYWKNGRRYFECVLIFESLIDALKYAECFSQIAVYSFSLGACLPHETQKISAYTLPCRVV